MLDLYRKVSKHITNSWEDCKKEANLKLPHCYALPYPYVPPCPHQVFIQLYYWDTYSTNRGLIIDGLIQEAKDNVNNLIYLLNRFGKVPNANSEFLVAFNSQPPYLYHMVRDVDAVIKDEKWLHDAYLALQKEYQFWMRERMTACGLNRHHHHELPKQRLIEYFDDNIASRIDINPNLSNDEKAQIADQMIASAEMGQDFNPRFHLRGKFFCPVDLNANLYGLELYLSKLSRRFNDGKESEYELASKHRKELMNRYMLGEDGLYYDFDFEKKTRESLIHTGQSMPFFVGLSTNTKAFAKMMDTLLLENGLTCTDRYESNNRYQWGYPHMWPGEVHRTYLALKKLNMDEYVKALRKKYMDVVAKNYEKSGKLYEAYDALTGEVKNDEYEAPEMMGWTAGCFQEMYRDLIAETK